MKKLFFSVLVGIVACVVILGNIGPKDSKDNNANADINSKSIIKPDTNLIVKAKRHLGNLSKDPDSIQYKNVTAYIDVDGNSYACGEFNAKNSFGAYVGYRKFIYNGSTLLLNGETKVPFTELEQKFCKLHEISN
ncbi:hypothetical protein RMB13_07000 [Acinetobacter sp. V102_4]|uniref:hypothetical protein n=1 Tax=Acinetobacter sp. V102_4 TaxID=3072984 RepID=UPI00287C0EB2|nr:hypothetical protein [Acinetobacter sp. V102_4]MDS7929225.1 hypothetical protein [Acinetobacter sp. V102_4]